MTEDRPLVSVRIIAYQNAPYISECIDSVLMQKTNFPFEICIGEDGSTDGTREICLEYQEEHPDKVRVFLWDRSDPKRKGLPPARFNFIETMKRCRGKYIALLDGDDYWTDRTKLERQVKFLEENKDFSMCFHSGHMRGNPNTKNHREKIFPEITTDSTYTLEDFLFYNKAYSASVLYKSEAIRPLPDWFQNVQLGDYTMHILALINGNARCLNRVMSVYRVHSSAIQSELWGSDEEKC